MWLKGTREKQSFSIRFEGEREGTDLCLRSDKKKGTPPRRSTRKKGRKKEGISSLGRSLRAYFAHNQKELCAGPAVCGEGRGEEKETDSMTFQREDASAL